MSRRERLSKSQARRIALAAQGFCDPRPAVPTLRTVSRTLSRTGVLQVDSVNVLERAHYLPLYSRMGAYDRELLARAGQSARPEQRRLVEYWAHVQALMPVDLWPYFAHRRAHYRAGRAKWWGEVNAEHLAQVIARIASDGPATARDLDDGRPRVKQHWGWNWSTTRKALDFAFMSGELAMAGRTASFEPRYDLPERVLPLAVLEAATPPPTEAHQELVRRAARSHGVATIQCLRDYYRMSAPDTALAVRALMESGELQPVAVEGWDRPAFLWHEARLPRQVHAQALLSPFDPVVWERARAEALFGFRYRIEIYTPAAKRIHGYYVLPFLLDEELVARVDLKADRSSRRLLVRAAHGEDDSRHVEVAESLADELAQCASWLGLDQVVVEPRGDLAPALTARVHSRQ